MSLPISGFTAVPNPMMLSFLASQGFAIMYFGGAGWQFGKRKVSGMTNEEVNMISPHDFMLKLNKELKGMVPSMQQGMADMTPLIHTTMVQFGAYIREAIKAFPEAVGEIFAEGDSTFRGNLAAFGSSSLIGTGGRRGQTDVKLIDQIMAAIVASKKGTGLSTTTKQAIADAPKDKYGNSLISYKGKLYSFARLQALLKVKETAAVKVSARAVKPQVRLGFTRKRSAGQSQRLEKTKLIAQIRREKKQLVIHQKNNRMFRGRMSNQVNVNLTKGKIRSAQQRLSNLLARYQF